MGCCRDRNFICEERECGCGCDGFDGDGGIVIVGENIRNNRLDFDFDFDDGCCRRRNCGICNIFRGVGRCGCRRRNRRCCF